MNDGNLKISIVLTSYNYEQYISECIQSVIDQTFTNWELIIIDDGSKDNSINIIKEFCSKDERIKLFTHPQNENKGLQKTLEYGINLANNQWITLLESDDILSCDYLEKKSDVIKKYNDDINLIFNECEIFGDKKRIERISRSMKRTRKKLRKKKYPANMFYDFYCDNNIFTFSSVTVKKSDLLKIDFNTPIDCLLDWWIYIQLAHLNNFYYIPSKLTKWRLHPSSYINKSKPKSPFALQTKAYYKIYKNTRSKKILAFIIYGQICWIFKKINHKIEKLFIITTKYIKGEKKFLDLLKNK